MSPEEINKLCEIIKKKQEDIKTSEQAIEFFISAGIMINENEFNPVYLDCNEER